MPTAWVEMSTAPSPTMAPLARIASSTLAPAGSATPTSRASPGRADQATAMCSSGAPLARSMDLLGAADEGIDEGAGDLVEHRADGGVEQAVGEGVAHVELDPAGAGRARIRIGARYRQRCEAPQAVELRERAVDQRHLHRLIGNLDVAGGEGVAQARVGEVQARRQAVGAAFQDLGALAPGQELRIGLD